MFEELRNRGVEESRNRGIELAPLRMLMRCYLLIALMAGLSSCVSHDDLMNLNQGPAFPTAPVDIPRLEPLKIQKGDLLYIQVFSPGEGAAAPFNLLGPEGTASDEASTFKVDENGIVELPGLGPQPLAGLTLAAARDTIKNDLNTFLNDPIVHIRFLDLRFSVLGEVRSPGTITLPEERITIFQALGFAGDLTNYGDRTNILVVRERDGKRTFGNVNIQDRNVFQSPYFYLEPNDLVYVYPTKAKVATVSDQANKVLPWVSAGAVLLNLVIILSRR